MIEAFVTTSGQIYTVMNAACKKRWQTAESHKVTEHPSGTVTESIIHEEHCQIHFQTPLAELSSGAEGSISFNDRSYQGTITNIIEQSGRLVAEFEGKRFLRIEARQQGH